MDVTANAPLGAGPGIAGFEEDSPRPNLEAAGAAPLLRLGAFEGRLDWLLELARARKVDLARLSLVEVADQLIADHGDDPGQILIEGRDGLISP